MSARARAAALSISILGAGLLTIAVISGVLYEQVQRARDRERLPQVGRSVDIGGRILNIYCSGSGQPAIILESGASWAFNDPRTMWQNGGPRPGYSWVSIQRELAKLTTVCWYDRAGSGWSGLGPYPRDSASQARDLRVLLQRAGVAPPYVLVAESSAALDARVYAALYPAHVAGLVLVDAVHPDLFARTGRTRVERLPRFVGRSQDITAQLFNQIGLYRFSSSNRPAPAPLPRGMTASEWNTIWRLTQASKARTALLQEIASWAQSLAEARAAGSLGDRPLFVVSSENEATASKYPNTWMELQTDLAQLSTRGKYMPVDEGNGELIYQAPDAIIEATRQVLTEVRQLAR
jgi:pimeloyl-ACP methyl ester carboxylesterase